MTHVAIQRDLFGDVRAPVLAAWGMGVDSTAMLIELLARGEPVDHVLTADTGSERPQTYAFRDIFMRWLRDRGVPVTVVRYEPKNFKHYPPYRTLDENVLTNGTLPSQSFGFSSCSAKWKIQPQDKWTETWAPAQRAWAGGGKVVKLIGYDCSPADQRRYAEREGHVNDRYDFRYPLREWGWTRSVCEERITREGLPVPPKSACYMCAATKPRELHDYPPELLRRIVLMEARAAPRLRNVDGLWRKPIKGMRGATARPGSMTEYIRQQHLLPADEIDAIAAVAPAELVAFQDAASGVAVGDRPGIADWLKVFELRSLGQFDAEGMPFYGSVDGDATNAALRRPAAVATPMSVA